MPNAGAPSGPGKPVQEREDAVKEQEGLDEVEDQPDESSRSNARQAERDAHRPDDNSTAGQR